MKLKIECASEKWARESEWHSWFAWLPVRIGNSDVRWLERVERRCYHNLFYGKLWEYRGTTGAQGVAA